MTGALRYVLRRVLLLLVTMLLVSLLTYLAFELVSGDPARTMLGTEATEAQVQALRHELGLDRPFFIRYVNWLGGFFSGNLGISSLNVLIDFNTSQFFQFIYNRCETCIISCWSSL